MSSGKTWYASSEVGIPPLGVGLEDSMFKSTIRSSRRRRGLGGMIAVKNGDPDVRGGKFSPTPNPNQALERGQLN